MLVKSVLYLDYLYPEQFSMPAPGSIGKFVAASNLLLFIFSIAFSQHQSPSHRWTEIKRDKKGIITIYYDLSKPFIYKNEKQKLTGIEYELFDGFKQYLKQTYHADVSLNWKDAKSFENALGVISQSSLDGIFGASAFSITEDRKLKVNFSPSYMSDISVMISSKDVPIVKNHEEFKKVFSKLHAITIRGTTYEHEIAKIRKEHDLTFPILYIPSSHNILRTIESRKNAFGFIDLPVYMMVFNNNPSVNINRQNLFPLKGSGYGIIYPKNSDWEEPISEYFTSNQFKADYKRIIAHYIDYELYSFIENLAIHADNDIVLLTKEKEIQYKDLLEKAERIEKGTKTRNYLISLSAIIFIFLLLIIFLYKKSQRQKEKIEIQQNSIALKKEQLEKRNEHLIMLNEEKNNLIRILAHDLRTPINHIQGLANVFLLSYNSLSDDQKTLIQQIKDSSIRVSKMIINILDIDALENNRMQVLKENVRVYPALLQVFKEFEKAAQKKQIQLTLHVENENYFIKADSLFLVQIFENLLSNALKFSEKETHVSISMEERNGKIEISFKDQGPGLSVEDQSKLYKKFERLSARPTQGETSTGLGLSIVKKYVELMDGEIFCESELGKGTRFMVKFDRISEI